MEDSALIVYIKNQTDTISTRILLSHVQSNNLRMSPLIREMIDNNDSGEPLEFEENDVYTAAIFLQSSWISVSWNKDWFRLSHKWRFSYITDSIVDAGNQLVNRYKSLF
jgi:hypothetical protein